MDCRPTFKLYRNGKEIAKLISANPGGLKNLIEQHASTPEENGSSSLNVQGHVSECYILLFLSFCISPFFLGIH